MGRAGLGRSVADSTAAAAVAAHSPASGRPDTAGSGADGRPPEVPPGRV